MAYMTWIDRLNRFDPADHRAFFMAGQQVGWVASAHLDPLGAFPDLLTIEPAGVRLTPKADESFLSRTEALSLISEALVESGDLRKKHKDTYPVVNSPAGEPLAYINRTAAPFFGVRAYGVHMNGYVRTPEGIKMWLGRRAFDKFNAPGKLDNMVAGGQPAELSFLDNLAKECGEEAAIPENLARQARPVGAITYRTATPLGCKPDFMACYDLELPADFAPEPADGEVHDFTLLPVDEVLQIVRETDEIKSNCNLVILDFALRWGVLSPDREPDYEALLSGLRRGADPFS